MNNWSLFIISFFTCLSGYSQIDRSYIDSLNTIGKEKSAEGFTALRSIGHHYRGNLKYTQADSIAQIYLDFAKELGDDHLTVKAFADLLSIKSKLSQNDSVNIYADYIFEFLKDNKEDYSNQAKAYTYLIKGKNSFYEFSDTESAYLAFKSGLESAEMAQDAVLYLDLTWNICNIYFSQNKLDVIPMYIDEALLKTEKFTGRPPSGLGIGNLEYMRACVLGETSKDPGERNEAKNFIINKINKTEAEGNYELTLSCIVDLLDNFGEDIEIDSKLEYLEIAYDIRRNHPEVGNTVQFLTTYGSVLYEAGRFKSSILILKEAEQLLKNQPTDLLNRSIVSENLIRNYIRTNQKDSTISEYQNLLTLKDSTFLQKQKNEIEKIQMAHAIFTKEAENDILAAENNLIQSQFNLLFLIGLLLAGFSMTFFFLFYKLKRTNRKLERINNSKNQLFAILAHDLKGPALAFNNLTENLSFLLKKGDSDRILKISNHFEKTGNQVKYIVDNLLNWAVSQKDSFIHNPQKIKLKEVFKDVLDELEYLTSGKNVTVELEVENSPEVIFDSNAFRVIIRNLVHNAVKYSNENSSVIITADKKNNSLRITDFGAGMDSDLIYKVQKSLPITSKAGINHERGSGIGLSTCVQLARKNNSKIKFESKGLNQGTTVILEMNN